MEPKKNEKSLEELIAEKNEVTKKITDLDAKGEKSDELNKLRARHEELTKSIEEIPNADEMHKAA